MLLSAGLLSVGCSSVGPRPAMDTASAEASAAILADGIAGNETLTDDVAPVPPVDEAVLEALMPEPGVSEDASRFDLSVNGAGSHDFFRSLVAGTPYNMVVHPDVNGDVSLELKNVSVPEVMEVMREVYGYDYVRSGNLFQVYPDVVRTEIFQIEYLNIVRSGRSEVLVSAGSVSDTAGANQFQGGFPGQNGIGPQAGNGVGNGQGVAVGGRNGGSVVGTVVSTDAEADFWAELETTLAAIVDVEAGGQVMVTPQVGLVVVRARPKTLHAVRDYIERVRGTLGRQVILEAKILEVTLREGFQAGINWNTFGEDAGGTFEPTDTTAGSSRNVAGEFLSGTPTNAFNPLGSSFRLNALFKDFEAAIDLLETQGAVQVLSSPRISTLNNQKAVIKVGGDEFFVTDIASNTFSTGGAINVVDSPQLTPFFSGIALDVTPQIGADGEVTLHIHPTVSEVEEQLKTISGQQVPLASSTIRESDSIIRALNGQVVVLGGLMQNSSNDEGARVPLLGRIPLLGHLFKQTVQASTKSELVILLKPTVVDSATQNRALQESLDSVESLRKELGGF